MSDIGFLLYETENVIYALSFYIKANLLLLFARLRMLFLCRGALKSAEIMKCEVFDLEERKVEF